MLLQEFKLVWFRLREEEERKYIRPCFQSGSDRRFSLIYDPHHHWTYAISPNSITSLKNSCRELRDEGKDVGVSQRSQL